mgnify:CR=1 FL=1|tara:strand:+ start:2438 stop:3502 length:1065 start_codon:yes stop_codon:yes gene_type:complete
MKSINKIFKNTKILSFDKFFEKVLYDKKYGYYNKKIPFGINGDFITSPDISFLFSEVIGIWVVSTWQNLNKPKKFNFIELGPGNGSLSKILHKTFMKFPEFYKSTNFYLYEKSQILKKLQKKKLKGLNIQWIENIDKIKTAPSIFFGNEFFDAIPIKQFEKKNGFLYERFIQIDSNLKFKIILKKATRKQIENIKKLKIFDKLNFIEFPKAGLIEMKKVIKKIKLFNGGILLIDYGYIKSNNNDTLQSIKNHKKNKIFDNIGESDVTSLVNFELLKNNFIKNNLHVEKIMPQGKFLRSMGIMQRAQIVSKDMSFKSKADIFLRLQRLLNPKYMGDLFKVIFACKYKIKNIDGFN